MGFWGFFVVVVVLFFVVFFGGEGGFFVIQLNVYGVSENGRKCECVSLFRLVVLYICKERISIASLLVQSHFPS